MHDMIIRDVEFDPTILAGQVNSSSMEMYIRDFKAYLKFSGTPDMSTNSATLGRWIVMLVRDTDMSPNTINRMISAVKKTMYAAAEQGYVSHEVAESFRHVHGVRANTMKDRTRIRNRVRIGPEVMRKITDSINTSTLAGIRNKALFATLASSGLRIKEFSLLTQQQIIRKGDKYVLLMYAETGKNQEEDREAFISVEAVQLIETWIAARPIQSDYIFTSFRGRDNFPLNKPITPQGAWDVVKTIAEPFVPGVKPHDFRRFVGTQLAKKDIRLAQEALGHKNITTTAKYDLREIEPGATDNLY